MRRALTQKGYKIAEVTIDFSDWDWNDPYVRCTAKNDLQAIQWLRSSYNQRAIEQLKFADEMMRKLFKRSVPQVLLLHIGAFDSLMLEQLIRSFRQVGVQFISLGEAENDPVYQQDWGTSFDAGAELTYQVLRSRKLKLKDIGLSAPPEPPLEKLASICN